MNVSMIFKRKRKKKEEKVGERNIIEKCTHKGIVQKEESPEINNSNQNISSMYLINVTARNRINKFTVRSNHS